MITSTPTYGRIDLDSHADTCVLGKTFVIYEYTGQQCTVHPYSSKYKPKTVKIAHGGTAYDHPTNGKTYILDVYHGFDMSQDQDPSLINPNQLRANNIKVDDCPIHLSLDHSSTHSITFPEQEVTIPLELKGVILYFHTRLPSTEEIDSCEHIALTSVVEWDPHSQDFLEQEQIAKKSINNTIAVISTKLSLTQQDPALQDMLPGETTMILEEISPTFSEEQFLSLLESNIRVKLPPLEDNATARSGIIGATISKPRTSSRNAETLSRQWGIGLETAERTLRVTTQRGTRTALHPLHRRYRTAQQQFRYNRLNTRFYSDTMFSLTKSIRGSTCSQVFVNDCGFSKHVPMRSKGEAGNALDELFNDVGVPTSLVTDGALELTQGRWKEIRDKHGGIKQSVVEPYSPWQNRAESEIREIKKQTRQIMQQTKHTRCCGTTVLSTFLR